MNLHVRANTAQDCFRKPGDGLFADLVEIVGDGTLQEVRIRMLYNAITPCIQAMEFEIVDVFVRHVLPVPRYMSHIQLAHHVQPVVKHCIKRLGRCLHGGLALGADLCMALSKASLLVLWLPPLCRFRCCDCCAASRHRTLPRRLPRFS